MAFTMSDPVFLAAAQRQATLNQYIDLVMAGSPAGFWPCQDTSGGGLVDVSGNGRHATKVGAGTVTYQVDGPVPGMFAVANAGASGTGWSVADADVWSAPSFTMEALLWMNSSFFGAESARGWASKYAGSNAEWNAYMTPFYGGRRQNGYIENVVGFPYAQGTGSAPDTAEQTWFHAAIRFNASAGTSGLSIVQNGVVVDMGSPGSGTRMGNTGGALNLLWWNRHPSRAWNGRGAMLAFHTRVLSTDELAARSALLGLT